MISAAKSVQEFQRTAEPELCNPSVWLSSIQFNSFRNYPSLSISIQERPVILVGPNGAGKTNILEGVSLLAPGRGLRRSKAQMWPYKKPGEDSLKTSKTWSVSAEVNTEDGPIFAGTGTKIQDDGEPGRRIVKLNGEMSSQTALAESFAVTWLTPEMDDILASTPSEKRRFLDRLVIAFDPAHAGRLLRFEKLHRQRNRLLQEGQIDDAWLTALEAQMAESGVAIIAARQSLVQALNEETSQPLPMFPSAYLHIEGNAEEWLKTMPAIEVEDRLANAAKKARLNGDTTLQGPTSSHLVVKHSETGQSAEMSSTGEQKALVISTVLAHARLQAKRLQRPPILLLDDIVSHLDKERRASLFELITTLKGQVWFSGTDLILFDGLKQKCQKPQIFQIEDGIVTPKHN